MRKIIIFLLSVLAIIFLTAQTCTTTGAATECENEGDIVCDDTKAYECGLSASGFYTSRASEYDVSDCGAEEEEEEIADEDDDGVADDDDVCEGYDDAEDADSDTVPDGCDVCEGEDDTADDDGNDIADCLEEEIEEVEEEIVDTDGDGDRKS